MPSTHSILRWVAALAGTQLCDASDYRVKLRYPPSHQVYDSDLTAPVVENLSMHGEVLQDGRLASFPCGNATAPEDMPRLMVSPSNGLPFEVVFSYAVDDKSGDSSEVLLARWSADAYWGHFNGTRFDSYYELYARNNAIYQAYRRVGIGEWCLDGIPLSRPNMVEIIGDDSRIWSYPYPEHLEGANATLAVRFTYYDPSLNHNDLGFLDPVHITTECIYVQFSEAATMNSSPCTAPDNRADTREEALGAAASSSVVFPVFPSLSPRPSRPLPTLSPTRRPPSEWKYVGIGVGAVVFALGLVYIWFRFVSTKKKSGGVEPAGQPNDDTGHPGPTRVSTIQVPPPSYQPRPENSGIQPVIADGGLHSQPMSPAEATGPSKAVDESLPAYGELPPRYEASRPGPSRQS